MLFPNFAFAVGLYTHEALRAIERRHAPSLSLDDPQAATASLASDDYVDYHDLEAVKLQQAILSLPTKQQLTFNLRYYDDLSYDQIAEITNATPQSAKANYHWAKQRIKAYMDKIL